MWPFSRRPTPSGDLPQFRSDDHEWTVAEAEYDSAPLIVRINSTAATWLADPRLPIKLGFAVPLIKPMPGGLPDPEENLKLNDVEDTIVGEVERRINGLFVLALSTGEMKEFVFYTPPDQDFESLHQAAQQRVTSHEVQCQAVQDPGWEAFRDFAVK